MPTGHKVALFNFRSICRAFITTGVGSLNFCKTAKQHEDKAFEMYLKVILKRDNNKDLVNSYKKVQRMYYPEKDLIVRKKINGDNL